MFGLTIASQKGGVGKTTVALNLSYAMARRGWRTLLVDTDPAGAIGLSLTKKLSQAPGLADHLYQHTPIAGLIVETKLKGLGILPTGKIPADESERFTNGLADGAVLKAIQTAAQGRYDVVVYDTPSGFVGATLGAMRASRYVVSPVQAEPIAARGVMRIFEVIGALRAKGHPVELLGILLTMLHTKTQSSLAVAEDLWKTLPGNLLFEATVPRDPAFLEASAAGVPVGLLRRRPPPIAMVFDQLAAELEARLAPDAKDVANEPIALVD
ncbi:MAG: ParA family protein [Deltaproteobacteria bacterium]|jgi:chromosome partitioning protein|nr:ParA family protein [Deltaproteobacteria bacterium]